ncbi:hypothetical protein [Symbioplanes lichenis]|uniref:hypothetical protein n=1 Tax=Symbioplanes lichenis TaxID=1629072 RepID=UPI00273A045B|nr:hypothetical protein [Actinoplanes lichenis]
MADWFRVNWSGGVNFPRNITFTDLASGAVLPPDLPLPGQPRELFHVPTGHFRDIRVTADNFTPAFVNTGGIETGEFPGQAISVGLQHVWPYALDYSRFSPQTSPNCGFIPIGTPLDAGDYITACREDKALPGNVVEIWIHSDLWWFKRINVPDGEGSSWDIWTGAPWLGGRRFDMGIGLWAHQVNKLQYLTFLKAEGIGTLSAKYVLQVSPTWLPAGSRVTFNWISDSVPGT